jgi:hypothetical protein
MEISSEVAAYLAGAMDSDGSIGLRRSTYAMRVGGDARVPVYSERIGLKQVTPQIPTLLRDAFGGSLMLQQPSVTKGRPLYYWEATNKIAAGALVTLLPYLRIKRAQAEVLLELRASKDLPRSVTHVHREAIPQRTGTGTHMIRRMEMSPETLVIRQALYLRIKELNKMGTSGAEQMRTVLA